MSSNISCATCSAQNVHFCSQVSSALINLYRSTRYSHVRSNNDTSLHVIFAATVQRRPGHRAQSGRVAGRRRCIYRAQLEEQGFTFIYTVAYLAFPDPSHSSLCPAHPGKLRRNARVSGPSRKDIRSEELRSCRKIAVVPPGDPQLCWTKLRCRDSTSPNWHAMCVVPTRLNSIGWGTAWSRPQLWTPLRARF